jgi:uncharacterized protein with FMN-binding domain
MKKLLLSLFVFFASAGYIVYQYMGGDGGVAQQTAQTPVTTTAREVAQTTSFLSPTPALPVQEPVISNPTPPPTPTPKPIPTPTPKPKGQYADGTYTGSPADAYYGMVQIRVVIQGGKLVTVDFLQYPNDRQTSLYINGQAMPLLKEEAIQAQSANVSGVSGASDTSQAFIQSLGDALAQAKNA